TAVFAVFVAAIFAVVRVVMAMGMAVRMLVVVVVRLSSFAPPRAGELPDRDGTNCRENQDGNTAEEYPDKEHLRQYPADHSGHIHQDGDQANRAADENREQLVEEVRPLAFTVALSVSMGMSHIAPSLSAG